MRFIATDVYSEMDKIFADFNKIYDERTHTPACEVIESEDHYLMSVDVPGLRKEDIKIETTDNALVISGERKREQRSDNKQKIQRYEKTYGFFKRSFNLPNSVDIEKVEAHYENGVLDLYLPKVQSAKPRQIEIQSGKEGFFSKLLNSPHKAS